ncbi:MAG: protease SohB [Gammaproteobacteria bacterium]|nr:protease SohB [Gammaproteobacteria bacterium]MBT5203704.1 protease SohB [Gammaproteobacteria bacterium]MBT5601695.1 protease SohB [Gammaproteobacteria bacterium]MBT6245242.1 protease SohB [Gammaproteobacteria bacterium]
MEFLFEYGLFLAKCLTVLVSLIIVIVFVLGSTQRGQPSQQGELEVKNINEAVKEISQSLTRAMLNPIQQKAHHKADKKRLKQEEKNRKKQLKRELEDEAEASPASRVFVLEFDGDVQASAVDSLREEVSAVLSVANPDDEIIVKLESPGGVVHGYGLAASQLQRIKAKSIKLTVAVDKVAASGGYMMACIADKIIAAPFALLGSIGVVAQIPNFHRFLKNKEVDVEVLTAGEYKRTLTLFGENTESGKQKFIEELEDVHALFKEFVSENRPQVQIEEVSTGEAWYGKRALEVMLVDELMTSDEYIIDKCEDCEVFSVQYNQALNRWQKIFKKMQVLKSQWHTPVQHLAKLPDSQIR